MADPLLEPIATAFRELFINTKVGILTGLLLLVALSHVGVVFVILLAVFFCGGRFHS